MSEWEWKREGEKKRYVVYCEDLPGAIKINSIHCASLDCHPFTPKTIYFFPPFWHKLFHYTTWRFSHQAKQLPPSINHMPMYQLIISPSLSLSEGKKEVNNRKEEGVTWLDTVYNIKSWAQCIFIKASQHINRWVWTLEYIFNQNNDGLNSTLIELISDILHQQSNIPFHQFPS